MNTAAARLARPSVSLDLAALGYRAAGVLGLSVGLAILSDAFLTAANLLNVLRQASLTFLIGSGATLVIVAAGIDLSIGANVGLSACLAAAVFKATGSMALGVVVALACGTAIGALNGLMVTLLRLPPFIATYGMLWMLHGATYWFMAGQTIYGFPAGLRAIGSGYLLGIPVPVYLMAICLAAGGIFARYTVFGHEIYAIGANPEAARLSGIPVRRRLNLVYTLSGAMAGLAALVYLARLNSAEADIGEPLMLPAIAAILIGGTSLFGGIGGLSGTMAGAVILTLVLNGMNLLNVNSNWQPLVTGVIVLLAATLDTVARRRIESRA
ncbi:MAG: ABC transporter permease [Blastocatellia bacterium]|nr:MAG: ABC transporter permease [Blastocatellia bacterium]